MHLVGGHNKMKMMLVVAEHDLCCQHSPPGDPSSK